MLEAFAVLIASFTLDFVWVYYTKAIADHRTVPAATWAGTIMLITGFNVIAFASHWYLVIFAAIGAATGTYVAMRKHPDGNG